MIDHATSTDAFPIPFYRDINGAFDAHVLRHTDGTSRLLVAFSIPARYLPAPEPDDARDSLAYPIHLHIAALRLSDETRIDLDTIARVRAPVAVVRKDPLNALFEMPIPAGTYSANVWLLQLEDSSGVQVGLDTVTVSGPGPALQLSDVVMGTAASHVGWNSGEGFVPFNPLGEYPRGSDAEVYFQLAGLVRGTSYRTRFEFFRDGDKAALKPELSIAADDLAGAEWLAVRRTIGLKTLAPGRYRVRVTVSGAGQQAVSTACLTIVK
jgi:hypothetical protein